MTEIIQGGLRRQRRMINDDFHRHPIRGIAGDNGEQEPAHLILLRALRQQALAVCFDGITDPLPEVIRNR